MKTKFKYTLLFFVLILSTLFVVHFSSATTIGGNVTLEGSPLSSAHIKLINNQTGEELKETTASDGSFAFETWNFRKGDAGQLELIACYDYNDCPKDVKIINLTVAKKDLILYNFNLTKCITPITGLIEYVSVDLDTYNIVKGQSNNNLKEDSLLRLQSIMINNIGNCPTNELNINITLIPPIGEEYFDSFGLYSQTIPPIYPGDSYSLTFSYQNNSFEEVPGKSSFSIRDSVPTYISSAKQSVVLNYALLKYPGIWQYKLIITENNMPRAHRVFLIDQHNTITSYLKVVNKTDVVSIGLSGWAIWIAIIIGTLTIVIMIWSFCESRKQSKFLKSLLKSKCSYKRIAHPKQRKRK